MTQTQGRSNYRTFFGLYRRCPSSSWPLPPRGSSFTTAVRPHDSSINTLSTTGPACRCGSPFPPLCRVHALSWSSLLALHAQLQTVQPFIHCLQGFSHLVISSTRIISRGVTTARAAALYIPAAITVPVTCRLADYANVTIHCDSKLIAASILVQTD